MASANALAEAVTALRAVLSSSVSLCPSEGASSEKAERLPLPNQACILVKPANVDEVSSSVKIATQLGLSVSAVGGLHSRHGGRGDLVLDMSTFDSVEVNQSTRTIKAGGGVVAGQIQAKAAEAGWMVPLGTFPTVGLGLVLQGGIGHLSRSQGLALDGLVSASIVVANGQLLEASDAAHQDLMWALRGCGTNFAVVVSITLAAVPIEPVFFTKTWTLAGDCCSEAAVTGLQHYFASSSTLPRKASADCIVYIDDDNKLQIGVFDCVIGKETKAPAISAEVRELFGSDAVEPYECTLMDLLKDEPGYLARPGGATKVAPGGIDFFVQAVFLPADAGTKAAPLLLECLAGAPCNHCYIWMQHAGGAVADKEPTATAFDARALEWSVVMTSCWPKAQAESLQPKCEAWCRGLVTALTPMSVGLYPTDLGPADVKEAKECYYTNRQRLVALKKEWDPKNTFRRSLLESLNF